MKNKLLILLMFIFSINLFGNSSGEVRVRMRAEVLERTQLAFSLIPLDFVEEDTGTDTDTNTGGSVTSYNTTIMKYDFGQMIKGSADKTLSGKFLLTLTRGGVKIPFPTAPVVTLIEGTSESKRIDTFGKSLSTPTTNIVPLHYELFGTPSVGALDFTGILSITAQTTSPATQLGKFINNDVKIKATISGVHP